MCVARDRDTEDGGKKGQLTSNPADIDEVVRRAWKAIYDGIGGNIETAIEFFLNKYTKYILRIVPCEVQALTGERIYAAFFHHQKVGGST